MFFIIKFWKEISNIISFLANICVLVVIRKSYGDKTLSESVKYVISLKNTDINGNMSWETIFAIPLEKSILLNKTICGYNAINYSGKTSCGKLKKIICKQFGIDSDAIFIEKI